MKAAARAGFAVFTGVLVCALLFACGDDANDAGDSGPGDSNSTPESPAAGREPAVVADNAAASGQGPADAKKAGALPGKSGNKSAGKSASKVFGKPGTQSRVVIRSESSGNSRTGDSAARKRLVQPDTPPGAIAEGAAGGKTARPGGGSPARDASPGRSIAQNGRIDGRSPENPNALLPALHPYPAMCGRAQARTRLRAARAG